MKTKILGLKELRQNTEEYISRVEKGDSFIVVRKSRPVFKMSPVELEEHWETMVDFTEINKNGVPAKDVLKALRKMNARH